MNDKLRECPFCGGEAETEIVGNGSNDLITYCLSCGASVQAHYSEDHSVDNWNTRHQPKHETVEQWEKRTGETYPDDGPVYWSHEKLLRGYQGEYGTPERKEIRYKHPWILSEYKKAYDNRSYFNGTTKPFIDLENPVEIIVANHHGKPEGITK